MRVFISHSSKDKPAVEALALALRERGIDPWLDKWEIGAGDDIVASINNGLDEADAGLIVFSENTMDSRWVSAEVSYLIYSRIEEGKILIPVVIEEGFKIPPLLRALLRQSIDNVDAIVDGLLNRKPHPGPSATVAHGRTECVLVSLGRNDADGVTVEVSIGNQSLGTHTFPEIPRSLLSAQATFLRGFRSGIRRDPATGERSQLEGDIARLGREICAFCFPDDTASAVTGLVDGRAPGTLVEVCFEASDAELLGLPFEALRLPDDRLLAVQPTVTMLRRPTDVKVSDFGALAGPIKVLVAVGAPDEGSTRSAVLDSEHELHTILEAVESARKLENFEVRILEVGHPEQIARAIEADAYHVLHISCHGMPGALELETEDGEAERVTPDQLLDPIRQKGRPLPMVFLNSCHGGVNSKDTSSFAEALLRGGVPAVLAMQTSVSDHYATKLAGAFYRHLARGEHLLPSRALAEARKDCETERRNAVKGGASLGETQPEYATAGLYVAEEDRRLADFGADRQELSKRTILSVAGPVPQLRIDDLIGRRKVLRETLRSLRDPGPKHAGVVLTGIGGIGKSAVAGRAMQRLKENEWLVPAHKGRFDLSGIALSIGTDLLQSARPESKKRGELLANPQLDDAARLHLVAQTLAEDRIILVLDDFEQNLIPGGAAFRDDGVAAQLHLLAQNCRTGRLLITCRHPIPGGETLFEHKPIGPLSPGESRKLLLRLPALREVDTKSLTNIMRVIGGHPRMLELFDALLNKGEGRLPHVTEKLNELLAQQGVDSHAKIGSLDAKLQEVLLLGARDVLLETLLGLARDEGIEEIILQLAVSNLPVTPAGLAHMLADADDGGDVPAAEVAFNKLEQLSLIYSFPDGSAVVHRWTAEGIANSTDAADHRDRYNRAGRYRVWQVENESHDFGDGKEAVRNFLRGEDFDSAVRMALPCFDALRRFQQSVHLAAFAAEVLETLPEDHHWFAAVADAEAKALLSLGWTGQALARYRRLMARHERLTQAEPNRADSWSDLSVSYERVGDLYRALGQGDQAREYCLKSLEIRERLARAEPERVDYQRNLPVSYERVGDLYQDLGQSEQAREYYLKSLKIWERLSAAEPDCADYQRGLSVPYDQLGQLYSALGQGEQAREHYLRALSIIERLVQMEPDRADYQRDLSVLNNRVGDLHHALGQGERAREHYLKALSIIERLAQAEPDRADYRSDLSVSYQRVGDLFRALGQGGQARDYYLKSLEIREQLARVEPERVDYQRNLSALHDRVGDLYWESGQGEQAREHYGKALGIIERLSQAEPGRTDYQRDLSVAYNKVGDLQQGLGQGEHAHKNFLKALGIIERLVQAEPDRADYWRDLSVSYNKVGNLYRALGQWEQAREHCLKGLGIRERLAQAEPDRADYQRDLIVSFVNLSEADEAAAGDYLKRAWSVLKSMKERGILSRADEWMIKDIPKRLKEHGVGVE